MKLKAWRLTQGMTQSELADAICVRTSAVSRYERDRVPEPDIVARIYAVTQGAVTPGDFYDLPDLPDRPVQSDAVIIEAEERAA